MSERTLSKVCQGRMQPFAASGGVTKTGEGDCNFFFSILTLRTNLVRKYKHFSEQGTVGQAQGSDPAVAEGPQGSIMACYRPQRLLSYLEGALSTIKKKY